MGGEFPLLFGTSSAPTRGLKKPGRRSEGQGNMILQPVCLLKVKTHKRTQKKETIRQTLLTLFLRVELTSSVSFSKSSASFEHLDIQTKFDQVTFFSNVSMLVSRLVSRELWIYPMLGSRPCCSWKLSSANMAAWICSGA